MMAGSNSFRVDAFLVGVSKSASTWIHRCLREHPEIVVPDSDSLRYFDLKYHKGQGWYQAHFPEAPPDKRVVDPSPTYFRSQWATERIARDFPDARFILSLRNPVERAFSQFWHEKKEGNFEFTFRECMDRFLLYSWFIESGFYAKHLENWLQYYDRDRFLIVLFDDLKSDPGAFVRNIFKFLKVQEDFKPSVLNKKVNPAGVKVNRLMEILRWVKASPLGRRIVEPVQRMLLGEKSTRKIFSVLGSNKEYKGGINPEVRKELLEIYRPHIEKLEGMINMDLSDWKR